MVVFVLFGPVLCVVVPMVAVAIAIIIYVVAHYCISVPLSRHSQQGVDAAGVMMKTASSEEAADEMDNREGKFCFWHKHICLFSVQVIPSFLWGKMVGAQVCNQIIRLTWIFIFYVLYRRVKGEVVKMWWKKSLLCCKKNCASGSTTFLFRTNETNIETK